MASKRQKIKSQAQNPQIPFYITSGQFKGIKLFLESNSTTRPTKALVKKSFFDTMQDRIPYSTFIECFSGSGQMAFEALSRNAKKAIFFEKDIKAYANLKNNIDLFMQKTRIDINSIESYNLDFFNTKQILEKQKDLNIILYLDPPFIKENSNMDIYQRIRDFIQSLDSSFLQNVDILAIESMSDYAMYDRVGDFYLYKIATFGKTNLAYFQH